MIAAIIGLFMPGLLMPLIMCAMFEVGLPPHWQGWQHFAPFWMAVSGVTGVAGFWILPGWWRTGSLAGALVAFLLWRRGRRKLRKILRAAGGLALARLRKMAERMRRMPAPRRILRPSPSPA